MLAGETNSRTVGKAGTQKRSAATKAKMAGGAEGAVG
jgi:hypothetical protein